MNPSQRAGDLQALSAQAHALMDGSLDPAEIRSRADAMIPGLLSAQRRAIPTLGRFLAALGVSEDAPWWKQAAPAELFRAQPLFAGDAAAVVRTFESSGTTDPSRRSRALYSEEGLALMDASIRANAAAMLFPDGLRTRILVLAPSPQAAPGMIMAWGMDRLIHHFSLPGGAFLIGDRGLDPAEVARQLRQATGEGVPVTLVGASFGFVHLLDAFYSQGIDFHLPPGSRTLDAGGFKGRSREIPPHALRAAIAAAFHIPPDHAINLLGMTELASQLYDDPLAARAAGEEPTFAKRGPPWTRTLALDPATLEPVAPGAQGVLVHLDLANVERPCAVRTTDLGRVVKGGFVIDGRAAGEAAGCSLTVEALIAREARR